MRLPIVTAKRRLARIRAVACLLAVGVVPFALDLAPAATAASGHPPRHESSRRPRRAPLPAGRSGSSGDGHAKRRRARRQVVPTTPKPSGPATHAAPAPAAASNDVGRPKGRTGRWIELHAPGADRRMTPDQRSVLGPWIREYAIGADGGVWVLLDPGAPPALGG